MPMTDPVEGTRSPEKACLVLMFKSPGRSKRRIAGELGPAADDIAAHLFACAVEDMQSWSGAVCYAPADAADADWLGAHEQRVDIEIMQGAGNLGERINRVNRLLGEAGHDRQLFIGIDCPEMTTDYLESADAALSTHDVVLAPAIDGGVVLMGTRRPWPQLESLPWSETGLGTALQDVCARAGCTIATLAALPDVDSIADLIRVRHALAGDMRPARRALAGRIDRSLSQLGAAAQ